MKKKILNKKTMVKQFKLYSFYIYSQCWLSDEHPGIQWEQSPLSQSHTCGFSIDMSTLFFSHSKTTEMPWFVPASETVVNLTLRFKFQTVKMYSGKSFVRYTRKVNNCFVCNITDVNKQCHHSAVFCTFSLTTTSAART